MNVLENPLYSKVAALLEQARKQVVTAVNLTMVHTYFEIGRTIVEDEQQGELRAEYGKQVLKELSVKLKERFGKGFSEQNLRNMRQFFLVYQDRADSIRQKPSSELQITSIQLVEKQQMPSSQFPVFRFLNWSHYV